MILEILQPLLLLLQDTTGSSSGGGGTGIVESSYRLLQEGGLLMGALLVIYGQHKFYRYMIDKLEEKHTGQVEYLEGELNRVSQAFLEKTAQDSEMLREMTREIGRRGGS
jgi:hypothetical protein